MVRVATERGRVRRVEIEEQGYRGQQKATSRAERLLESVACSVFRPSRSLIRAALGKWT